MVRGGEEILLVEDSSNDVLLIKRALRRNEIRCSLVVARDGEEALEHLLGPDQRDAPRLVLLDLRLPKVDGLEVLRRLRRNEPTRSLPVVLLTSSEGELGSIAGSGGKLADLCIQKAVDFERLVQEVGLLKALLHASDPRWEVLRKKTRALEVRGRHGEVTSRCPT